MFKIQPEDNGTFSIKTDIRMESVSDSKGTVTILYPTLEDLKELQDKIWPEIMEAEWKRS